MKFLPLVMLVGATLLGGCASDFSAPQKTAAAANSGDQESYVSLGSNIPKKTPKKSAEERAADLQQLDNARTMNSGSMNGQ